MNENIDYIKGGLWPLQTYGWSGTQFGGSSDAVKNKKSPTSIPPMIVTSNPPGAAARDDGSWIKAYGASHDCVLSLIDGAFVEESTVNQSINGIYKDSMPHLQDTSLFRDAKPSAPTVDDPGATSSVQQIQYLVSKDTVTEAQSAAQTNNAGVESEIRGIGMRMPMMMAGWGKTVAIRPTDPEPTTDENKRKNDEEHKLARETWKHGAVDLRWDERRGVWGGWNDLIADHEGANLGTLVFSTNSDETCGFPFLKGKLEDVWWVRRTTDKGGDLEDGAGQEDDFIQTGEICTHLKHKFFDEDNDNAGPLKDVFMVDEVDNPGEAICGTETTKEGKLEIKTTAFFHLNDDAHGPVCFSPEEPEATDLVGCMKFNGAEFVPTVEFSPCEHDATKSIIDILFENDRSLELDINVIIAEVNNLTIIGGISATATTVCDASALAQSASAEVQGVHDTLQSTIQNLSDYLAEQVNEVLADMAAQINVCLEPLGCVVVPGTVTPLTLSGSYSANINGDVTAKTDVAVGHDLDLNNGGLKPATEPVDPCEEGASPIVTP